jgi:hypothetical protein
MDLDTLTVSTPAGDVVLDRADDMVAVHGEDRVSVHDAHDMELDEVPASRVGPVYRQRPGGGAAVPSGRVLVRYGDGDRIDRHRDDLAAVGYELEQVLDYAPQAGWIHAAGGGIDDSLGGLERVAALPGVVRVEPQLLREAAKR